VPDTAITDPGHSPTSPAPSPSRSASSSICCSCCMPFCTLGHSPKNPLLKPAAAESKGCGVQQAEVGGTEVQEVPLCPATQLSSQLGVNIRHVVRHDS
jgi:hypothetical protein